MFKSGATADAYNKTLPGRANHGTLIQNWHEESILRESIGLARGTAPNHISKKHEELFIKQGEELQHVYQQSVKEDTFGRVFGKTGKGDYTSEAKHQFQNRSGYKERTQGKKYELIEKQFINNVKSELQVKDRRAVELSSQGDFHTTYSNQFVQKGIDVNNLGRKVMLDQNGNKLSPGCRDQEFLVDNGFLQRSQIATDDELRRTIIQGDYTKTSPYTFWSDKINDGGVFYHSPASPTKSFGLNNSFVKTFSHYKQIKL